MSADLERLIFCSATLGGASTSSMARLRACAVAEAADGPVGVSGEVSSASKAGATLSSSSSWFAQNTHTLEVSGRGQGEGADCNRSGSDLHVKPQVGKLFLLVVAVDVGVDAEGAKLARGHGPKVHFAWELVLLRVERGGSVESSIRSGKRECQPGQFASQSRQSITPYVGTTGTDPAMRMDPAKVL